MDLPCDVTDRAMFTAATSISLGNGEKAGFWTCSWANGQPLRDVFPRLFKHSRRKSRSVRAALVDDSWIRDLAHRDTAPLLQDVLSMARMIASVRLMLNPQVDDTIRWNWTTDGSYSAASAY